MDTDCVDYEDYGDCLRDLARVNTVTLTHRPTIAWLARETAVWTHLAAGCRPAAMATCCDVSLAGGHRRPCARLDGVDPQSVEHAGRARPQRLMPRRSLPHRRRVRFQPTDGAFDFIVSSQFTHHLTDDQIVAFIRWMEAHARRGCSSATCIGIGSRIRLRSACMVAAGIPSS